MKRLILFFLMLVISRPGISQQPVDVQKLKDSVAKLTKAFEQAMKQQQDPLKGMIPPPATGKDKQTSLPFSVTNDDPLPLPSRNEKLLASIPLKTMTKAELVSYVTGLQSKLLKQKANAGSIRQAQTLMKKYPSTGHHGLAMLFFSKKELVSSLYVLCSVVKGDPANGLAISNLAAVLNQLGFPHKSIPVSRQLLAQSPQSAIVNNNLGQAYFQLGDMDNAVRFLSAAIRTEPFHIEANATLGYIQEARGNTSAAAQSYANSLNSGYNKAAADGMKRTRPSDDVSDKLRLPSGNKYPKTNDNIPFTCPPDPGSSYAAVVAFNAKMQAESEAWNKARAEFEEKSGADMQSDIMSLIRTQSAGRTVGFRISPLFNKAQLIMARSYRAYTDEIVRLENENERWHNQFMEEWAQRAKELCKGLDPDHCCAAETSMYNARNAAYMNHHIRYCEEVWNNALWHYNTVAYWYPYVKSVPLAARDLIVARGILLGTASKLTSIHLVEYTCERPLERNDTSDKKAQFKLPNCPVSLNIPLGIGAIKLTCEAFSVNLGEGVVGGMEYQFASGQSTVYIGAGVQGNLGVVNFEASATEFITFDSDFNVTDVGTKVSGGASVMDISPTLGLSGASASTEAVFGVNSGLKLSANGSVLGQSVMAGELQFM